MSKKNLGRISESGMTRRYWRNFCKQHSVGSNPVIKAKNEAYGIAFRQLKNWHSSWNDIYICFRLSCATEKAKELLPKLP